MIPSVNAVIITSVKGRLAHLQESLPTWLAHTPCAVCVATQACPDDTPGWLRREYGHERRVMHVDVPAPDEYFNKAACLNRAAALCDDDFCFFLDADTRVEPECWPWLEPRLDRQAFYVVAPTAGWRDLTGVLGVWPEHFWQDSLHGGYDVRMQGWGSEDLDLRLRLYLANRVRLVEMPPALFSPIPHDDALRTRHYLEQDKMISHRRNLQRLVENAERLTGRSIFSLMQCDPVVQRLFGVERE